MSNQRDLFVCLLVFTISVCLVGAVGSATASYQPLVDDTASSIIPVEFTVKMTMSREGGQSNTSQLNSRVNGILIDDSGTLLVSARQLQGPAMLSRYRRNSQINVETTPSDFEARLPGGTKLDAELTTKDSRLDLGFITITESVAPDSLPRPLNLEKSADTLSIGRRVILMSRFGQTLNYQPQVMSTRISAEISEPRRRYALMDVMDVMSGFIGAPALSPEGRFLGMMTFRASNRGMIGGGQQRSGNPFSQMNKNRQFLLPAEPIREAVDEALSDG